MSSLKYIKQGECVEVIHKESNNIIGTLEKTISLNWDYCFVPITTSIGISAALLIELSKQLAYLNKPAYKAPPAGFYRCMACGVEVPIKPVPYEEQAACPCPSCDGQVFCNEWEGWGSD